MGKVVKSVKKAVKKVTSGVGKVVKKVASGVKKLATGVAKGLDKVTGGRFSKIMGKLGPVGSIALSFLLPGVGSLLGGLWSSAAGAAAAYTGIGQGFIQGVGAAMNLASKGVALVKGAVGSITGGITSKIQAGLEFVGGKVADGAEFLFKGAQEFLGVKDPSSIKDIGSWVADKAQSLNPFSKAEQLPAQEGMFSSVETGAGVQNASMSPVSPEMFGNYDQVTPMFNPQTGEAMGNALASPATFGAETAATQPHMLSGIDKTMGQASTGAFSTGTGSIAGGQSAIAGNTYMAPGGLTPGSLTQPAAGINFAGSATSNVAKDSFMNKIVNAGGSLLQSALAPPQAGMPAQPYFAGGGDIGDNFASQRFGIGGQGSSGGDFLSEQQRYQQQILAQQLAQLG